MASHITDAWIMRPGDALNAARVYVALDNGLAPNVYQAISKSNCDFFSTIFNDKIESELRRIVVSSIHNQFQISSAFS